MKTKNFNLFISKNNNNNNITINEFMVKSGLLHKMSNGLYVYLPNGLILINNITNIIKFEMNKINIYEISMPILQPYNIFNDKDKFLNQLITTNIKNKKYILSPTNENEFLYIFGELIKTKKNFPIKLFQIEKKFRNEIRHLNILRLYEFIMKDGYSLHKNIKCLNNNYEKIYNSYINIFNKLNLKYCIVETNDKTIDSNISHEFYSLSINTGININNNIKYSNFKIKNNDKFIEIAHIFKIGKKNINYNNYKYIYMSSFGIGISRILYSLIDQNINNNKLILPYSITIFKTAIINIEYNNEDMNKFTNYIYKVLIKKKINTLFNNNKESYGIFINNVELIGIPIVLIVSYKNFINNNIEVILRNKNKNIIINIKKLLNFIIEEINY